MALGSKQHRLQALALWLVLVLGSGCARNSRSNEDFIPPTEQARAALETALQACIEGKPDGEIPGTCPAIIISDTLRRSGQKLERFEILGETPGDTVRCFAVRLVLDSPREELTARYAVLGIDPLLVLRHEDLEMLEHWDHAMMLERLKENQKPPQK